MGAGPHSLWCVGQDGKVGGVHCKTTEGYIPIFQLENPQFSAILLDEGEQDREFVVQSYRKYLWDCKRNNPVWQSGGSEYLEEMVVRMEEN